MMKNTKSDKNILKKIKICEGKYITGKSKAGSDNSAFIDYMEYLKKKKEKTK